MNNEEDLEQAVSKLYQSSQKAEPSAEVDAAILAQARERLNKISAKETKSSAKTWQRWFVPLSTAALLVMGVSVTIKIMNQPQTSYQLEMPVTETDFDEQRIFKDEVPSQSGQADHAEKPAAVMMFESVSDVMTQDVQEESVRSLQTVAPAAKARARAVEKSKASERKKLMKRSAPMEYMAPEVMGDRPNSAILNAPFKESVPSELEWSDPKMWIEQINQLLENNKKSEAILELERFVVEYPDYPLPQNLNNLINNN